MVQPSQSTDADSSVRLYQGSAGMAYHEGKRALRPDAVQWMCRLRKRKFARWIRPEDVVFEFGVGSGWNLALLKCARKLGCDASPFLADRIRALGIEFHENSHSVPDATADVVICHQTLEHLLDPPAALRELARILKPGGRLILHVPWEMERKYRRYSLEDRNHHLYHWNAQNLGNLVTLLGWRIQHIRVRRYSYDRFAANLASRLHLGEWGFLLFRGLLLVIRPFREVELIATR